MKKTAVIIASVLFLLCGCGTDINTDISSVTEEATEAETAEVTTTLTTTSTTSTVTTNTTTKKAAMTTAAATTTAAETTATQAVHETIERKVEVDEETFRAVEAVENGNYFSPYNIFDGTNSINYENEICFLVDQVSKVPNDTLGAIADEDDLIAKAREVFIAVLGQDFIDRVEADHIERDGEMVAIVERRNPLYYTHYYEDYGVWEIQPCLPSGTLENGQHFDTIFDNPPFLIVKGDSGKIIACRF